MMYLINLLYIYIYIKVYKMDLCIDFMESNKTKDRRPQNFKIIKIKSVFLV